MIKSNCEQCCAILCYFMLYNVTKPCIACNVMFCHVILCYVMLGYVMLSYVMPCYVVLCCVVMSCFVMLCYFTYVMLYNITRMLYHVMFVLLLCYLLWFCVMFYFVMFC